MTDVMNAGAILQALAPELLLSAGAMAMLLAAVCAVAQSTPLHFDAATRVFRLDGGNVSYVFGVNPRGELQQLYWGGRLGANDSFPKAEPRPGWASFDSSYSTTPQEYAGWGAGLFVEPALKVTFAEDVRTAERLLAGLSAPGR